MKHITIINICIEIFIDFSLFLNLIRTFYNVKQNIQFYQITFLCTLLQLTHQQNSSTSMIFSFLFLFFVIFVLNGLVTNFEVNFEVNFVKPFDFYLLKYKTIKTI